MPYNVINADELLNEALILNSELGRHVRKCSFSKHLSGRFYENHSLESYNARAQRISQMKAKRKQLEKSLILEEQKIRFLEGELKKKMEERKRDNELKALMAQSAIIIQRMVRRMLAMNKLELLKIEEEIKLYVVPIIQARFRGIIARKYIQRIRQKEAQKRIEELALIRIQCMQRCRMARHLLAEKRRLREEARKLLEEKRYRAACKIQACVRGFIDRKIYLKLLRHYAATIIQCMVRIVFAREEVRKRKLVLEKRKMYIPKRIPFHKRRYSIYSVDVTCSSKRSLADMSNFDCTEEKHHAACIKVDQDSRDKPFPSKNQKKESPTTLDDKVIWAQQRASKRATKLKMLKRLEKEKEEEKT
jgi:hypothetical protein